VKPGECFAHVGRVGHHLIGDVMHGGRGGGDLAPRIDQHVEAFGIHELAIDDAHGGDLADLVRLRVQTRGFGVEHDEGQVLELRRREIVGNVGVQQVEIVKHRARGPRRFGARQRAAQSAVRPGRGRRVLLSWTCHGRCKRSPR
jgi:hypothetical protein